MKMFYGSSSDPWAKVLNKYEDTDGVRFTTKDILNCIYGFDKTKGEVKMEKKHNDGYSAQSVIYDEMTKIAKQRAEEFYKAKNDVDNHIRYDSLKRRIKDIFRSGNATVVRWADGTKTVIKLSENDIDDPEKAFMVAYFIKLFGKSGYNKLMKMARESANNTQVSKKQKKLEARIKTIKKMHELGMSVEDISEALGIDEDTVRTLSNG